jgi:hypothetical protein
MEKKPKLTHQSSSHQVTSIYLADISCLLPAVSSAMTVLSFEKS